MGFATKRKALGAMLRMDNGWQLVLNRLLFPREPIQYCRYRGLEFITDLQGGDATGAREVLTSDEYSSHLFRLPKGTPLSVLDLGANNGGFPLLLLANGFEIQTLAAVELNPNTYRRLRFNIERNLAGNVFLMNLAVSDDGRAVRISESRGSTSDNIYADVGPEGGKREVPGATLDDVIASAFGDRRIDVCKIDIEGAEFEVLLGDNSGRVRQADLLLIEIHHSAGLDRADLIRRLEELGFEEQDGEGKTGDLHYLHAFANRGTA